MRAPARTFVTAAGSSVRLEGKLAYIDLNRAAENVCTASVVVFQRENACQDEPACLVVTCDCPGSGPHVIPLQEIPEVNRG